MQPRSSFPSPLLPLLLTSGALLAALVGCDGGIILPPALLDSATAATTGDTTATTGAGGAGGGGGAGGSGGATCPTGSHPGMGGACEATLTGWVAGPKIKHRRDHHVTLVAETAAGPFLYVVAGAGPGAAILAVERSAIAKDGSLSPFQDIAMLPEGLIGPGLAQLDRSFVIAGGLTDDSNSSTASYVGTVADDGSVTFTKGPDLGASRYHVGVAYAKGFVYALGGLYQQVNGMMVTQSVVDTVERAAFDGKTLSPFETLAPLPVKLTHHAVVVYDGALYVIGGGSTLAAFPDIRRATVSDKGDLGPWQTVGQLPAGRASPSATIFLDQLYVIAGMTTLASGEQATVLRGAFDQTGGLGVFTPLAPLPLARAHSHQSPLYAGHLYSVGGSINHVTQNDVFIGAFQ